MNIQIFVGNKKVERDRSFTVGSLPEVDENTVAYSTPRYDKHNVFWQSVASVLRGVKLHKLNAHRTVYTDTVTVHVGVPFDVQQLLAHIPVDATDDDNDDMDPLIYQMLLIGIAQRLGVEEATNIRGVYVHKLQSIAIPIEPHVGYEAFDYISRMFSCPNTHTEEPYVYRDDDPGVVRFSDKDAAGF